MPKDEVLIAMERKRYHERLLQTGTLAINANGVATNADKDSVISVMIAKGIAEQLMAETMSVLQVKQQERHLKYLRWSL